MKKSCLVIGFIILAVSMLFVGGRQEGFRLIAGSSDEELLPELTNCTIQTGVPYASDMNPYHQMNVYLPVGAGPFPAFVYIHGGGWVSGNCSEYDTLGQFYAKRGIAGFSIDYTLAVPLRTNSSFASWPAAIQDVIMAIRCIKENAKQYRIDPERIAVMGDSAGGQLASLAGTLSGNESFLRGASGNLSVSSRVCLVIDYYGPTDFQFIGEYGENFRAYYIISNFLGDVSYQMNQSRWIEASPATYITADDPVFVIVHGTNDTVVPIAISESFEAKLEAAGIETHFIRVEGGDHEILISQEENLQVRYVLEPLLKMVFNLQQQSNFEFASPIIITLILIVTLLFVVFLKRKRRLTKRTVACLNPCIWVSWSLIATFRGSKKRLFRAELSYSSKNRKKKERSWRCLSISCAISFSV
jgi:acetyl esterase/lipase